MSEVTDLHVHSNTTTDPYAAAATALLVPATEQADLVWESLTVLASTSPIDERSETNLHAVVHVGMNLVPVRDYVMATIAYMEADDARAHLLALSACTGSAPAMYRAHVAAATAMLSAAFDVERHVIERLVRMGDGVSLATLVQNGLDMRAPACLYRLSMQHCLPEIKAQLQAQ